MAALITLDADASLAEVLAVLDADGGVIVRDMISSEAVHQIVEDLAAAFDGSKPGSRSDQKHFQAFHGSTTKRFCGLAAHSRAWVDHVLLHPLLTAVADDQLLPSASDYWLNTGQVMAVGPKESAQGLHRDENNWPEALKPDAELTISAIFALNDFTKGNGATVVVPGTHRLSPQVVRNASYDHDQLAYAEMSAGSALIYSGKVVHGAGHNSSDSWRYGMHTSFVLGWLRPEEASPLVIDRDLAASLPERARELLGWGSYQSMGGGRTWLVDFEDASRLFS
jgi:ectoine hydroxylase-related dioxygenase (phytanoyl-CoA dioxygenase family)